MLIVLHYGCDEHGLSYQSSVMVGRDNLFALNIPLLNLYEEVMCDIFSVLKGRIYLYYQ